MLSSRTMRLPLLVLASLALAVACRRQAGPDSATPLPDAVPGFTAGPAGAGPGGSLVRTYARTGAQVMVTLARFPMDDGQYQQWVHTSTAGFPQAALDVPTGAGNGFYQCDDHAPPSCSLLVQLRSGVHLELRGAPASRADLDAVARALPLRTLASAPSEKN